MRRALILARDRLKLLVGQGGNEQWREYAQWAIVARQQVMVCSLHANGVDEALAGHLVAGLENAVDIVYCVIHIAHRDGVGDVFHLDKLPFMSTLPVPFVYCYFLHCFLHPVNAKLFHVVRILVV